jgi:hypothetical protein
VTTRSVYAALSAFVLGFAVFPPRVFLVVDEERYVTQAVAFANGSVTVPGAEILYPPSPTRLISNFPPGTSLMQTPFVWLGGWRMGAFLSVVALCIATIATMRWLRDSRMQGSFALLVPGFFGALFFGRIGMSDVPSAALVAGTVYLLWRSDRDHRLASFFAGLCAGLSLLFREPVLLLLAPILVGALLRGRVVAWALIVGCLVGVAARLVAAELLFGSPTYVRDSGYGFSVASLSHTVPVYAIVLLALLPGGALLPFFYRGPWRTELVTAIATYFGAFLLYEYDAVRENGPVKGLMLTSRYAVPALPMLAYMAADVWPRWKARLSERWQRSFSITRLASVAVVSLAFLVHPLARRQEQVPLAITERIYEHTRPDVPVITNTNATLKYLSPAFGARQLILSHGLHPDTARTLIARSGGRVHLVLLNRSDSELFRAESRENEALRAALARLCEVRSIQEGAIADWARLGIFDVSGCR